MNERERPMRREARERERARERKKEKQPHRTFLHCQKLKHIGYRKEGN